MFNISADLNNLGNSQIYRNPNANEVTVAKNATNVSIVITPIAGYDLSNTQTANAAINSALSVLGFTVTYGVATIAITRATAGLNLSILTAYNFDIRNVVNANISTENISIEILSPEFTSTQSSCEYCVVFNNTPSNTTSQNPPLANRGKLEYLVNGETKEGFYNEDISYCSCEAAENISVTSILTIRQIPNCGGTSSIVFQAISSGTIDIIEYKPSIQFEAPLDCCISKDQGVTVTPVSITANNDTPHNIGCTQELTLKYTLIDPEGNEVLILSDATGTISTNDSSTSVVGIGTSFTSFPIGGKLYNSTNDLLGIIASITDDTNLNFEENATETYSDVFKVESFFYLNPDLTSVFEYTPTELGVYKLTAILSNCCTDVITEWDINICKSYLIETGTCNNPIIKNLSSINYLKINLTTNNGLSLLDETTNEELYKDQLVAPLSGLVIDNLPDGFYKLVIEELDATAVILSTETQYLFFDCNIKNCQVKLTQDILCFQTGKCVDQSEKEYLEKNLELTRFFVYKEIVYSYWSKLSKLQSIPDNFDPEEHLQEIATYTEAITYINKICQSCNSEKKHCYSYVSYSKDYQVYVNKKDCGCNK